MHTFNGGHTLHPHFFPQNEFEMPLYTKKKPEENLEAINNNNIFM